MRGFGGGGSGGELTFRWFRGIFFGEDDFEFEEAAFPDGFVFAGDRAVPFPQVEGSVGLARGFGDETEGV